MSSFSENNSSVFYPLGTVLGVDGTPVPPATDPDAIARIDAARPEWQRLILRAFPEREDALNQIQTIYRSCAPRDPTKTVNDVKCEMLARKVMRFHAPSGWQDRIESEARAGMTRNKAQS